MALIVEIVHMYFDSTDPAETRAMLIEATAKKGFKKMTEVQGDNGMTVCCVFHAPPKLVKDVQAPARVKAPEADIFKFDPTGGQR